LDICPGDYRFPSNATARVCQNGPDSCSRGGDDDSICCEGDRQRDWRTRSTDTAFSVHSEYISRPIASTVARELSRLEMGCTNRLHHARVIVKSGNEREEVKNGKKESKQETGASQRVRATPHNLRNVPNRNPNLFSLVFYSFRLLR